MGNAQGAHHLSTADAITAGGSAPGHGGVRKKSRGGIGDEDFRPRTQSMGAKTHQHAHHVGPTSAGAIGGRGLMAGYDDVGPVDITASVPPQKASSSGYRPRATTEVGRRPPHRPQMSVESSSPATRAAETAAAAAAVAEGGDKHVLRGDGSKKMPTIFKYSGKEAKEVYVAGTFNNWSKMRMNKSTKDFVAIVNLLEGEHEYRFFVDGEWVTDKTAEIVDSGEGGGVKNNLIRVQKADFNAYSALDMDSEAVSKLNRASHTFGNEFGQDAPPPGFFEHRSGPPILPPHLLQVILNKDTPLSCEPTLLPEPNHVMLNHLYALSIKDGVMVLSATNRYRKKYVTTLLYKPMGPRTPPQPAALALPAK